MQIFSRFFSKENVDLRWGLRADRKSWETKRRSNFSWQCPSARLPSPPIHWKILTLIFFMALVYPTSWRVLPMPIYILLLQEILWQETPPSIRSLPVVNIPPLVRRFHCGTSISAEHKEDAPVTGHHTQPPTILSNPPCGSKFSYFSWFCFVFHC